MSTSSVSSSKSGRGLVPAKILLVGDRRVGTTSILRRFIDFEFYEEYRPQKQKIVRHTQTVYHTRHRREVIVQFWDVEGADTKTAHICAQKAHSVVVVYDVTNRSSFEAAQRLLDDVNPRASSLLIGTKSDLQHIRHVSHREGKLLARIHRVAYIEVSSLKNSNVEEAITYIVDNLPDEYVIETNPEKRILATRMGLKHLQEQQHQRSASDNALCYRCKQLQTSDERVYKTTDRTGSYGRSGSSSEHNERHDQSVMYDRSNSYSSTSYDCTDSSHRARSIDRPSSYHPSSLNTTSGSYPTKGTPHMKDICAHRTWTKLWNHQEGVIMWYADGNITVIASRIPVSQGFASDSFYGEA